MALEHQNPVIRENIQDALKTAGTPVPAQIDDKIMLIVDVTPPGSSTINLSDGTDDLVINSDGSLNVVQIPRGTQVTASGQDVNSGTTIYTVTAGKTFYCMGVILGTSAATTHHRLTVAGVNKVQSGVTDLAVSGSHPIFIATTGQAIAYVHTAGAGNGQCTIWGYEV